MKLGRLVISSVPVIPLLLIAALSSGIRLNPSGTVSDHGFVLAAETFSAADGQLPETATSSGPAPTILGNTPIISVSTSSGALKGSVKPKSSAKSVATTLAGKVYPLHGNIITTWFYVGEPADSSNGFISNAPSAWQDDWESHFGGVDNPNGRNFTPKENPYYFALPYNDFDENGNRKSNVNSVIPWAKSRVWPADWSICKNQWIKVTKGGKSVYAQWEDVGPFLEDDSAYVFGSAAPANTDESHAGLDVSPTVRNALGLSDVDHTSWQFVDASAVPAGPWKTTVTTSQTDWN